MSRQTEVGLENNHGPLFPVSCHTKRCAVGVEPQHGLTLVVAI